MKKANENANNTTINNTIIKLEYDLSASQIDKDMGKSIKRVVRMELVEDLIYEALTASSSLTVKMQARDRANLRAGRPLEDTVDMRALFSGRAQTTKAGLSKDAINELKRRQRLIDALGDEKIAHEAWSKTIKSESVAREMANEIKK